MSEDPQFLIALFESVSMVMYAERLLIDRGVPHKIIPVPKEISADCGVCIRFAADDRDALMRTLEGTVAIAEIRKL